MSELQSRSPSDLESRTRFEPAEVEPRIIERWLASGLFHPAPEGSPEENYSIAIPPPNVTGALHMGHALNGSIQDVLVRYHRMLGQRTKWILGTDHAGIATQTQVEKALLAEGTSREELGRDAFVERVWQWREQYGGQIIEQYKRMGASCDYEEERFTLDDEYSRAVRKVFVELFQKGYIYRDNYLVNWDPGSHSAISDLEVEDREVPDTLYSIAYPLASGDGELVVATVRPETMLADTAVAVHPDDDRYRHLVGQEAILPLVGRRLPIVADEFAKPEFGTGALKVTPGHDQNDFEIGRRHGLPAITVIGEDGRLTDAAGERFAGLTIDEARRAVVDALEAEGAIRATEPITHVVPFSHRSGRRIEPLISLQWFMRMDELAQPAIEAVASGRIRFVPERWGRVYLDWMENIRPWCISRQLWWGHQLPVWYCDACEETYVALSAPDRCGACDGELRRDPDVLDTWFSSALWPFATLGWPEDTPELRAFYPTDALVTAREIIFLWVARMVMMGLEFPGDIPFSDVYITSVIQAPDGRRMSKSLGTGIDPLQEIERHGADAVRFGLLAMSSTQDVRYSVEKIRQGESLANKLWNASRLILLRVDSGAEPAPRPTAVEDRWILSRLQRIKMETADRLARFDFSHAALGLYDFVYGELCDWYLEWVKPRIESDDRQSLSSNLLYVLRETVAVAHPVIPFVTEEIWSYLPAGAGDGAAERRGGGEGSALLAGYHMPPADPALIDQEAEEAIERVIAAVQALRAWRNEVGAPTRQSVRARLDAEGYESTRELIERMARFEFTVDGAGGLVDGQVPVGEGTAGEGAAGEGAAGEGEGAAGGEPLTTVDIPGGSVAVLAVDADLEAARKRREARRRSLESDIERAERKLANREFVEKAPAAVVEAERAKLASLRAQLEAL